MRFQQVREFVETQVLNKPQEWGEHKLLIIPCSKAKKMIDGKVPAIDLYDGPLYRLIRKRIKDFSNDNGLDIMILSAKYGLIQPLDEINYYDQVMTSERAEEIINEVKNTFQQIIENKNYTNVLVNLGAVYLNAFQPALEILPPTNIKILEGPIGKRLKATKEWIELQKLNGGLR